MSNLTQSLAPEPALATFAYQGEHAIICGETGACKINATRCTCCGLSKDCNGECGCDWGWRDCDCC